MTTPHRHLPRPRILLLFLALAVMLPAGAPAGCDIPAVSRAECPQVGPVCPDSVPHGSESRHCSGCLPTTAAMLPQQFPAPPPRTDRETPHAGRGEALLPGHHPPQLRPPSV